MKHLLLSLVAALLVNCSYGQKYNVLEASKKLNAQEELNSLTNATGLTSSKQTASGDTVYMSHIAMSDTVTLYKVGNDSGFVAGIDAYGDKAFAERYDFSTYDSSVKVIGVIARFGGKVRPTSTKNVTFAVWNAGQKTGYQRSTLFNSGFPAAIIASQAVSFNQLGVATVDTAYDTAKVHMFSIPTTYLSKSFFVGCIMSYAWSTIAGDTIGLYSNKDGERADPNYTVISNYDTTINNVNVTMFSNGAWHDNAVDNFHLNYNLFIFPVVIVGAAPTAVSGVTRNGFTFYGSVPNPAADNADVRFALAKYADVSIDLMRVDGTIVKTVKETGLSAGDHSITLNTSDLAAGDYVYLIRCSTGEGIASKLTVIR